MSISDDEYKKNREKMLSFVESLDKKQYQEDLISLIQNIGNESFEPSAKSFLEDLTLNKKEKFIKLLALGFTSKALTEEQIVSFFDALCKESDFSYNRGHGLKFIQNVMNSIDSKITTLPNKLMSVYFTHAIVDESQYAYHYLTTSYLPAEVIAEGYKLRNEAEQEKSLEILMQHILKENSPGLLFSLKLANPKVFKKVFGLLDKENQFLIKEQLRHFGNPLISLIENKKFSEAVNVFIHSPDSPSELFHHLDRTASADPGKRQLYQFFKKVLDDTEDLEDTLLFGFTAMRACFESKGFLNKYPNLFQDMVNFYLIHAFDLHKIDKIKEACIFLSSKPTWSTYVLDAYQKYSDDDKEILLANFLNVGEDNLNIPLIQGLKKVTPALFDKIFSLKDSSSKKIIQNLLLEVPVQAEKELIDEWTLFEEYKIADFNDFLEDPKNFSSGIEDIRAFIDGKYFGNKYPNLPKALISIYLKKAIELNKVEEVASLLSSQMLWHSHILKAYQDQPKENQEKLITAFLEFCGPRFNAVMIGGLREANPSVFDNALKAINDKEAKEQIENLLNVPVSARLSVSDIMDQFTIPFRRMTGYVGQLVCTETSQRKPYPFNPTVLYSSELREYLTVLKSAKPPIRKRFILAGDHWVTGEIDIPEQGNPRILFIDSLGSKEPKTHRIIEEQCSGFEGLEIYLSHGRRQHSEVGCTIFSLKDAQELFTLGPYLEPKYKGDLFEYISRNSYSDLFLEGFKSAVKVCSLPLRFMRSEQSRDLLSKTIPGRSQEEQSLPVNKRGETASVSSEKHFTIVRGKRSNERLAYKLNKMAKQVFSYLSAHDFNLLQVESEMSGFSFEGFKAEMNLENLNPASRKAEDKESKEDRESLGIRNSSLLLTRFSSIKSPGLQQYKGSDEVKEAKEKAEAGQEPITAEEAAMEKIRTLLQEKFEFRVFLLGDAIGSFYKKYAKGEIENVGDLKKAMKAYLEIAENKEHRLIDAKSNVIYLEEVLEKLPLIEKFYPNVKRPPVK